MQDTQGGAAATARGGKGMIPAILPRAVGTGQDRAKVAPDEPRKAEDRNAFARVEAIIAAKLASDPQTSDLREQVRYTETREGLRIEIVDRAGFSMFELGTDRLLPRAARLMRAVASGVVTAPNPVAVRDHTDAIWFSRYEQLEAFRAPR